MKLKLALAVVLVSFQISCGTLQPQDSSFFTYSEPTLLVTEHETFYVNIEFVVFAEEIKKYPIAWENFQKAIDTWASKLPIRIICYLEDPQAVVFPGQRVPTFRNRYDVISVHFDDLQGAVYGIPTGVLGLWHSAKNQILIDADAAEANPERAYTVALHELGHLFGVPHIVNFNSAGLTGFVVLPPDIEARDYVMYPRQTKEKPIKVLSDIEIQLARQYILHQLTTPGRGRHRTDKCEKFSLDKSN